MSCHSRGPESYIFMENCGHIWNLSIPLADVMTNPRSIVEKQQAPQSPRKQYSRTYTLVQGSNNGQHDQFHDQISYSTLLKVTLTESFICIELFSNFSVITSTTSRRTTVRTILGGERKSRRKPRIQPTRSRRKRAPTPTLAVHVHEISPSNAKHFRILSRQMSACKTGCTIS